MIALHTADIQIETEGVHSYRAEEFKYSLNQLLVIGEKRKAKILFITGDIFQIYNCGPESRRIFSDFLRKALGYFERIVITNGNHDLNENRGVNYYIDPITKFKRPIADEIENIVTTINSDQIWYLDQTGMFQDEKYKLVYMVWNHKSKYHPYLNQPYSPWETESADKCESLRKEGYTIIDLYHDPTTTSKGFHDQDILSKISINDFKGDIVLAGDIHLPEITTNENGAIFTYCSSLVARNYGEGNYYRNGELFKDYNSKHGLNIVDLDKKSVEFLRMENPFSFHTLEFTKDFDFENIDFEIEATDYNRIKLRSIDFSWDETTKSKIKDYLRSKYNLIGGIKESIKHIQVEKEEEKESLFELSDISSVENQERLLQKFYEGNEYAEDNYEKLKDIHNLILGQVDTNSNFYDWQIKSFGCDNLRSLGKIDFMLEHYKGVIKVSGNNGQGKTTFTDNIVTFVLFSNTRSTNMLNKKHKEALNEYFNKSLESDTVYAYMNCQIQGENFLFERKLERIWKKEPKYYQKDEDQIRNIEKITNSFIITNTDKNEVLKDEEAEELVKKVFVDYDQMMLLYFNNSYNISHFGFMPERDRNQYILNILGLDIYAQMKEVFKSYRKEIESSEDKIVVKGDEEQRIKDIKEKISENIETIDNNIKVSIELTEEEINLLQEDIFNASKKITPIPDDFDESEVESISIEQNKLVEQKEEIEKELQTIPEITEIDIFGIESRINAVSEEITEIKYKKHYEIVNRREYEINLENYRKKIKGLEEDIVELDNEIRDGKVSEFNFKIENLELDDKNRFNREQNDVQIEIDTVVDLGKKEGSFISDREKLLKFTEKELEKLNGDLICDFCGIDLSDKKKEVARQKENAIEKISQYTNEIKEAKEKKEGLLVKYKELKEKFDNFSNIFIPNPKIKELYKEIDEVLATESFPETKEKEKELFSELKKKRKKLEENNQRLLKANNSINELEQKIVSLSSDLQKFELELEEANKAKERQNKREVLLSKKDLLSSKLENIEAKKAQYEKYIVDKKNNEKLESEIAELTDAVSQKNAFKNSLSEKMNTLNAETTQLINEGKQIEARLTKYREQMDRKKLFDTYDSIFHKTKGISSMLFNDVISELNQKLNELLDGLNFYIYFDVKGKNNPLKMVETEGRRIEKNIRNASMMEMVLSMWVLKSLLVSLNKNSRGNIVFNDEIFGILNDGNTGVEQVDDTDYQELASKITHRLKTIFPHIMVIDHTLKEKLYSDHELLVYKPVEANSGSKLQIIY